MASKGPKSGADKPVSKVTARPRVAPKAKVAAIEVEKPEPAPAETVVPFVNEPEPILEAAPQEVKTIIEAAVAPTIEAAEAAVETAETVQAEIVEPAAEAAQEEVVETVAAAEAVAEPVKEQSIMETIENSTVRAQAFFGEFNERTKAAVEKSTKLVEEANEFAKGNLEAIVESGRITAKGFESFGQEAAEYSRKSFESATAAMKNLAAVKSPTEFFKLQSDYFRTAFDSYVAEASKNTEALIKLAGDAAQPLSNRVAVAAEKAKLAA